MSTSTSNEEEISESEFSSPEVKKANMLKRSRKVKVFKVAGSRRVAKVRKKRGYKVQVEINGHRINTTADTGAEINVIAEKTAKKLDLEIQKTKMKITGLHLTTTQVTIMLQVLQCLVCCSR